MAKKLERVFRERPLSAEERARDARIRISVEEEFPPKLSNHIERASTTDPLQDAQANFAERFVRLAQTLVDQWQDFFAKKGPGAGDLDTNAFMKELRVRAQRDLGADFSEQPVCGENRLAPDFYFPDEATIVEVAMGLRNPSSEFERDILKAIMAQEAGHPVRRLLFLSKPGAVARTSQPGLSAFVSWAERVHGITVEVREFTHVAESVLEPASELGSS